MTCFPSFYDVRDGSDGVGNRRRLMGESADMTASDALHAVQSQIISMITDLADQENAALCSGDHLLALMYGSEANGAVRALGLVEALIAVLDGSASDYH